MLSYKTKDLVKQKLYLLIPLIIYAIYKNGYLIYSKKLISSYLILKPLYLVLIGIVIKILFDLIKYKKIVIDYNLLEVVLLGMIVPYNINILMYSITLIIMYPLCNKIAQKIKFNKVCLIYLVLILLSMLFNQYTFKTPLDLNYSYEFSFLNLLMGRSIGGISSTSIFFSLLAYIILLTNYYYKKDIPFIINITYLILSFSYFLFTNKSDYLINSDLIFASIFIATIPMYSPYKRISQIIYSIIIGIISFIITIYFDRYIGIYIAIFILSIFLNIDIRQKPTKLPLSNS